MLYSLAPLDDDQLNDIKAIEKEIGKTLLAFRRFDIKLDDLSEDQVARIQQAEVDLGVSLIAVK